MRIKAVWKWCVGLCFALGAATVVALVLRQNAGPTLVQGVVVQVQLMPDGGVPLDVVTVKQADGMLRELLIDARSATFSVSNVGRVCVFEPRREDFDRLIRCEGK